MFEALHEIASPLLRRDPMTWTEKLAFATSNGSTSAVAADCKLAELQPFLRSLGSGAFCDVHTALYHGEEIAVKVIKEPLRHIACAQRAAAAASLAREIKIMALLHHPNILRVIATGADNDGFPFLCVDVLKSILIDELPKVPGDGPFWQRLFAIREWPLARALRTGVQLAEAIRYCHDDAVAGYRVLHRDLKPDNIGIAADGRVVLLDFGIATLWKKTRGEPLATPRPITGATGTQRYMAPEVARCQPYCHKAEAFSFASLMYYMIAHMPPFHEFDLAGFERSVYGNGYRPALPQGCTNPFADLHSQCWDHEPAARPEFSQIVRVLRCILSTQ